MIDPRRDVTPDELRRAAAVNAVAAAVEAWNLERVLRPVPVSAPPNVPRVLAARIADAVLAAVGRPEAADLTHAIHLDNQRLRAEVLLVQSRVENARLRALLDPVPEDEPAAAVLDWLDP